MTNSKTTSGVQAEGLREEMTQFIGSLYVTVLGLPIPVSRWKGVGELGDVSRRTYVYCYLVEVNMRTPWDDRLLKR